MYHFTELNCHRSSTMAHKHKPTFGSIFVKKNFFESALMQQISTIIFTYKFTIGFWILKLTLNCLIGRNIVYSLETSLWTAMITVYCVFCYASLEHILVLSDLRTVNVVLGHVRFFPLNNVNYHYKFLK